MLKQRIAILCCALLAGCQSSSLRFLDSYTPGDADTPLQAQLQGAREIKPGMSIDAAELLLQEHGFSCVRCPNAEKGPYMDCCASESDGPISGTSLLVRLYYKGGKVTRREAKGQLRGYAGLDGATWAFDPEGEGNAILWPQIVQKRE